MQVYIDPQRTTRIPTPAQTLEAFARHTRQRLDRWTEQLAQNLDAFTDLETEIDQHFQGGAGQLTAALLDQASQQTAAHAQVHSIGQHATPPLRSPQRRPLALQLLGGLTFFITTLYAPPKRPAQARAADRQQPGGLYPELAALGIFKGCSPALQYRVARTVALSPSIAVAKSELRRQGLKLNYKKVRRLAEQLGLQLLALRQRELLAWRGQTLAAGTALAGRRVAVQIDGGRVRLREKQKGKRGQRKGKRSKTRRVAAARRPWREPKVLTIFAFDEHGRMSKEHCQPLIDGTLQGPDHVAELTAYHLHRLGAAQAEVVVFVSDGAPWIWERLPWIVEQAGLDRRRVVEVLDFYHAAHHISLALEQLGLSKVERLNHFRRLRQELKQSRYEKVVAELRQRAAGKGRKHKVWTEIAYLEKHGLADRLQYRTYRRRGLPSGSGAVESAIRRVINLRLKGNGIYWLAENAEAMFAVRAALLTERWEESLVGMRASMAQDRRLDWRWSAAKTTPTKVRKRRAKDTTQVIKEEVVVEKVA